MRILLLGILVAALVACQGSQPQQLPLPTVSEDANLKPAKPSLPPLEDSQPRPLATVRDTKGNQADFVENELIVSSDDPAALNAFVQRWQGSILKTFDPATAGLSGVPKQHLVRIRADAADTSKLSADLYPQNGIRLGPDTVVRLSGTATNPEVARGTLGIPPTVPLTRAARRATACRFASRPAIRRTAGALISYSSSKRTFDRRLSAHQSWWLAICNFGRKLIRGE